MNQINPLVPIIINFTLTSKSHFLNFCKYQIFSSEILKLTVEMQEIRKK